MLTRGTGLGSAIRAATLSLLVVAGGCGSTEPEERPTSARIRVEGTTPVPLRLVVSTDFFEVQDAATLEVSQVIESADTLFITPPYDETVDLGVEGNVLVDLSNDDDEPAQVRMRVDLDSGQSPYDQSATMSEGGALRYVFTFFEIIV